MFSDLRHGTVALKAVRAVGVNEKAKHSKAKQEWLVGPSRVSSDSGYCEAG